MKIGYSLLISEYINAEKVDYSDCKNFQIVCPSCKEPVFKVERELDTSSTHYLSHYSRDKAYVDECELRITKISQSEIQSVNTASQNQKLEYFLSVLKDAIIENEYTQDDDSVEAVKALFKQIGNSAGIQFYKDRMYELTKQQVLHSSESEIFQLFDDYIADITKISGSFHKTSLSIEMQKRIAYDILHHIISAKARGNYSFLFSHGYITLMKRIEAAEAARNLYEYERFLHHSMRKLIGLSKHKGAKIFQRLAQYPIGPPHATENSNLLNKMASEITHEMLGCLIRLPYFEMIKTAILSKKGESLTSS
jgi:hypothetical protein